MVNLTSRRELLQCCHTKRETNTDRVLPFPNPARSGSSELVRTHYPVDNVTSDRLAF